MQRRVSKEAALAWAARDEEVSRLRAALREVREAAHEYLNELDIEGRMRDGTPRLNGALGAAFNVLHPV